MTKKNESWWVTVGIAFGTELVGIWRHECVWPAKRLNFPEWVERCSYCEKKRPHLDPEQIAIVNKEYFMNTKPSFTIMNAEVCNYCGGRIRAMIFRGSGYCSVDCAKGRPHDAKPVGTVMT